MQKIKHLLKDEEGATMVEYALMLALIAVLCIFVVGSLGGRVLGVFTRADEAMSAPPVTPP